MTSPLNDPPSQSLPHPHPHPHPQHHPHQPLTIRFPPFTYLHLSLQTASPPASPIDNLTARLHLTAALQQFLGLTGAAIPVDILHVRDQDVWVRVGREDGDAVVGAVGAWVEAGEGLSWRVRGRGDWLGAVVAGGGRGLFDD